jgi:hypothetical protein
VAVFKKRKTRIIVILLVVMFYGIGVAALKGKLANQTATLIDVYDPRIKSLVPKNLSCVNLPLGHEGWEIIGENVSVYNSDGRLVLSGTYTNGTVPMFIARQTELELNFTENPYFHVVVSSSLASRISFHIGWLNLNSSITNKFLSEHPELVTEIDETSGVIWVNISYLSSGEIDDKSHYITMNVGQKLIEYGLDNQHFVGLQIRQYPIDLMAPDSFFETAIESLCLMRELPYHVALTEGTGQILPDGSIVHIVERNDTANYLQDYPYLERAYILYTMDAPNDSLYTIFLLTKQGENLTVARSGYIFGHSAYLNKIGTHIDWKRLLNLNHDYEPLATLQEVMNDGDYAIVFTPLKDSQLNSVQLYKIEFTFSTLPSSSSAVTDINENALSIMSIFIVSIAGILPTFFPFALLYLHKKNRLKDDKTTVIKLVVVGLALRFILAPISAFADDVRVFSELGALYYGSGVFGAQWVSLPGFVYVETAVYLPYALLRALGFQDFQFLSLSIYSVEALFTKIPSILCDLGTFYYLLRIAKKYFPEKGILVSGLFLLSPLTIYISGILGQFDSIFMFLVIACIYYLVVNFNTLKATIFSGLAAVLNPVGLATAIPLLASVLLKESRKAMIKSLLLIIFVLCVSILPFFFETKSPLLLTSYERLTIGVPGETFHGIQIIFYAYGIHISSLAGYGLTFRSLLAPLGIEPGPLLYPYGAAFLFLILIFAFVYKIRKDFRFKESRSVIYTGTFMLIVASLFQLTFPTIFDQFVIWVAGLLLVAYVLCRNRKLLSIFILVSIATGFIYILAWRNYLLLVSGVEAVPFGNPVIAGITIISVGTLYSIALVTILVILIRVWIQKAKSPKTT